MDAGARLRLKRESLGLSQQDVASVCRVDVHAVQGWELNLYAPPAPLARRLAHVLALQVEQVPGGHGLRRPTSHR